MWWNSTRKGFYLRNYRRSALTGLFKTLSMDPYGKNSLCTSVNCQWGPDQWTSHLHKHSKVDCYIINLTTTHLYTRQTDCLIFCHEERGSVQLIHNCCLNIHTDGKYILWTTVLNLNSKSCTFSVKGYDFGADIIPTMHHCALCNEQFTEKETKDIISLFISDNSPVSIQNDHNLLY